MELLRETWSADTGWVAEGEALAEAHLVLYFVGPDVAKAADAYGRFHARYPGAEIVGCSTGGEIAGDEVLDDSAVAVVIRFDKTTIRTNGVLLTAAEQSQKAGGDLARGLLGKDLRAVYVLADGILTNGSALIAGMREVLGPDVVLTGGLAGDGARFRQTLVGCNGPLASGVVVGIGLYGDAIRVGFGSYGGWERFGPERMITRSRANVLYELDGEPALDLYKRYLGEEAANLPGSALLFPLTVRPQHDEKSAVVRTIVGVDDTEKTMTFAGDVPQGYVAQLMRGHFDGLVEGASHAGEAARQDGGPVLALLVSCIGRKLLMGQRIVDEVEAAADALGAQAVTAGFYSYGEIAPHGFTGRCELHNQTMTVTTLSEA